MARPSRRAILIAFVWFGLQILIFKLSYCKSKRTVEITKYNCFSVLQ